MWLRDIVEGWWVQSQMHAVRAPVLRSGCQSAIISCSWGAIGGCFEEQLKIIVWNTIQQ